MRKNSLAAAFGALLLFFGPGGRGLPVFAVEPSSWNGSIPEDLRRPRRGEAPRYPRDTVIGELGAGEAPEAAYTFGRSLVEALAAENRDAPILAGIGAAQRDGIFEKLRAINPQRYRIGGGREEPDGSISFLIRFLGREQGIAGELYLRPGEDRWLFDDLILEEPAALVREGDPYRYDFSPYERFY